MSLYFGRGSNNITCRTAEIYTHNRLTPSKTLAEAKIQHLKFYRDACRRMPYILKNSSITNQIHPTQAKLNLATFLRQSLFARNPRVIDSLTIRGYDWLHSSIWCYNHHHNFVHMIMNPKIDDRGYNYLDDVRYANSSSFLKDFYSGKGEANY
ncbi:unnamed protein product [Blepharisma stoltei]|uniref:Uncharacterized protein n=1 Tax=Blepharisma stoltei TaxID=1481888 RepID=A0AAU9K810_9CILI|nr:unnamed protein product [Blepharisma stoltei]